MAVEDVIWLALVIFTLHRYIEGACYSGGSSDCIFPCNCANDAPCDNQTGACPGGCRDGQPRPISNVTMFDWRGPGCRIGNVALHKTINQSGEHGQWYANQSVDGTIPSNESEEPTSCAHTATSGTRYAWWSVDLEAFYHIYSITIFNRKNGNNAARTANLSVRIGNNSDFSDNTLCLHYTGPVPAGGSDTLNCTYPTIGRFVSLQRTGGSDTNIINICEVVVMGYEAIGVDCSRCDTDCNNIVGCNDCVGFEPPSCIASCDTGRYGINCISSCSDHHCKGGNKTCNHVTGECLAGCQDWYIGGKCDTHISDEGYYSRSNVSAEAINTTNIKVTWGPDDDISPNLTQYYGYQVQYKVSNDCEFLSGPDVSHEPGVTEYSAIIGRLIYNTWYTLRVSVYRQNGVLYEVSQLPTETVMVKTPYVVETTTATYTISISKMSSTVTFSDGSTADNLRRMAIAFAVLFGVSAIVNIVFAIHCLRMRIRQERMNTLAVKTPEIEHAIDNYEGLVGSISSVQEGSYDELHTEENQVEKEPVYEQM